MSERRDVGVTAAPPRKSAGTRALTVEEFRHGMWRLVKLLNRVEETSYRIRAIPPEDREEFVQIDDEFSQTYRAARELHSTLTNGVPQDATESDLEFWRPLSGNSLLLGAFAEYSTARASATSLLQNKAKSAIKEDRGKEQRSAEGEMLQALPQGGEEPRQPDTETEIAAIQRRGAELSHIANAVAGLGLEGVDVQVKVAGLHEIGERCKRLARHVGIQAVANGSMSQARLSRLLGVAPMTVNRWVKDLKEQQPEDQ